MEEGLVRGLGKKEQAEEIDNPEEEEREEAEVQAGACEYLGCEKECKGFDEPEEGVGELELEEEGGGCLQSKVRQENAVTNLVEEDGECGIARKGVEGEVGEGEHKENTSTNNVGDNKNNSHDSGLSRSNDVSFVENE